MEQKTAGTILSSNAVQRAKYAAIHALIGLVRHLPYLMVLNLFRCLSVLAWLVDPFHRRVAGLQMRAALGPSHPWYRVLRVFLNHGEIPVDTIRYAFMSDEEIRGRIIVEGREHLDAALSSGRGVMMVTGHIGNWEVLAHMPRVLGIRLSLMADVRNDPKLEAIVNRFRARCGATFLPPVGTFHHLVDELRQGRTIIMVVDLRGDHERDLLCDVLGMPAPTKSAPAAIALNGDALVLPVYAIKSRGRHHWYFSRPVEAARFGRGDEAVRKLSEFMQSWLVSVIREHPEQWFWFYSRWLRRSEMRWIVKNRIEMKDYLDSRGRADPASGKRSV